jgi:hypothetical protein
MKLKELAREILNESRSGVKPIQLSVRDVTSELFIKDSPMLKRVISNVNKDIVSLHRRGEWEIGEAEKEEAVKWVYGSAAAELKKNTAASVEDLKKQWGVTSLVIEAKLMNPVTGKEEIIRAGK